MTHPTTRAVAEIKRALALANSTKPTPTATFGFGIESGPAWIVLADGKHADGVLYRRVKRDVLDRVQSISSGDILPIKKICSPEFWVSLGKSDKQRAGRYLAHMVSTKEVNLALVSLAGVSPQLYCKT